MALIYLPDDLPCVGQAMACDCNRCTVQQENDQQEWLTFIDEERIGPPVWASERRRGESVCPQARARPAAPLAGFHQLGDDADGEGWS